MNHKESCDYVCMICNSGRTFQQSYQQRDAFIATQAPMVNTLVDFWLLVFDHKLEYILMLNQLDNNDEVREGDEPEVGNDR